MTDKKPDQGSEAHYERFTTLAKRVVSTSNKDYQRHVAEEKKAKQQKADEAA